MSAQTPFANNGSVSSRSTSWLCTSEQFSRIRRVTSLSRCYQPACESGGYNKPRPLHSWQFRPYIWPIPPHRGHVTTWVFKGGKFSIRE